jgi:uncharacterized YigZ family protein
MSGKKISKVEGNCKNFEEYAVKGYITKMDDTYTTIQRRATAEVKVQGSRFVALAVAGATREEIDAVLESVRKEYFDATHHCYAYRFGTGREAYRMHDDGEPAGTGGRPILTAIDREGLTDVVVVVTRYFGGIKLGVGGLARAYGEAATQALRDAGRETRYVVAQLELAFSHDLTSAVMHCISRFQARIIETGYDEQVHMRVEIRQSMAEELKTRLVEQTGGRAAVRLSEPGGR